MRLASLACFLLLLTGCPTTDGGSGTPDPECGNGDNEADEECDDGNTDDGDGCSAECLPEIPDAPMFCGDGTLDEDEICDDGGQVDGDGCSANCLSDETCGNEYIDYPLGEECDDGNNEDGDGCSSRCLLPGCGDGVVDDGEACDDENTVDGDGCSADCSSDETCGNDVIDYGVGETCDDGNTDDGDGCQGDCLLPVCGDGITDSGEACDDGNTDAGDGCSALCDSDETCGNDVIDILLGETCDDGNVADGDGCSSDCVVASCGNGVTDPGEVCDDGNVTDGDGCSASCGSDETCGNGVFDPAVGEECEDGNNFDDDGCSATCLLEFCGNGLVEFPEVCDDGNNSDADGCNSLCSSDETCGNGVLDVLVGEGCDDGNVTDGDGCQADCEVAVCGDGILDPVEVCDDGNTSDDDGCSAACDSDETCGNGFLDADEGCDDGNNADADGCQADCEVAVCGDGIADPGEICDDGNTTADDGCSADCNSDETCGNGIVELLEECDDGNPFNFDGCNNSCEYECPADQMLCDDTCVDTEYDPNYCGDCSTVCAVDQACFESVCVDIVTGGGPGGPCEVTLANYPQTLAPSTYGFGDMTCSPDGIVIADTNSVFLSDSVNGTITQLASDSSLILGVTYHPTTDVIYVSGDGNEFWSMPTAGGSLTSLTGATSEIQALEIAPEVWGAYGDHVIAGASSGVRAYNTTTGTWSLVGSPSGTVSDIAFAADGTLYAVHGSNLSSVSPTGTVVTVGSGLGSPDGVTIDDTNNRALVADGGGDILWGVDLSTGTATNLGSYDFDSGYFTSGVLMGSNGVVLLHLGESVGTLVAITSP